LAIGNDKKTAPPVVQAGDAADSILFLLFGSAALFTPRRDIDTTLPGMTNGEP
jgi:hypothetical protein